MTKIRKTDESTAYKIVEDLKPSFTDVDGSYTGRPMVTDYRGITTTGPAGTAPGHTDRRYYSCHVSCPSTEQPVQDADDL
ncbi:MAG: hypothetical protein IJC68_03905 [Firmicutes bacterium]|nr:hypothetical protein [Bacillota bacterium]